MNFTAGLVQKQLGAGRLAGRVGWNGWRMLLRKYGQLPTQPAHRKQKKQVADFHVLKPKKAVANGSSNQQMPFESYN